MPALNVKAGVDVLLPSSETRQSRKTKCLAALAAAAAADGRRTGCSSSVAKTPLHPSATYAAWIPCHFKPP